MSDIQLISSKLEDYLATIFHLVDQNRVARVSDIAQVMGVQMPTVTGALRHLAEHGLVNYEPYQFVTLTEAGAKIARGMIRRHDALKRFLAEVLSVPDETAEQDACGMEHALSEDSLAHLMRLLEFLESCPRAGTTLIGRFRRTCSGSGEECEACVGACLEGVHERTSSDDAASGEAPDSPDPGSQDQ